MTRRTPTRLAVPLVLASCLLALGHAVAAEPAAPRPPPPAPPPPCQGLPPLHSPASFGSGEVLEFSLDAMGAQAGRMTLRVLSPREGALPVQAQVETNTFFSKVRRVNGTAVSYLHPRTLRPSRYSEESVENEVRKTAEVAFGAKDRSVKVAYSVGRSRGEHRYQYSADGLDTVGAIYLMRQLPLREGLAVCFDVYGIRRLWRLTGQVQGRERVSLPLGDFDAWHLKGVAVRLDNPRVRREVHVWVTDDARRLPLAAVGVMDVGAVRATLQAVSRPGEKQTRAQGKESLKW